MKNFFGKFHNIEKANTLSVSQKLWLVTIFVGIISFAISSKILLGYLQGDDESLYMTRANEILYEFRFMDLQDVSRLLILHDHPPLPILILTFSIAIFGFNIIALRLPNVILWVISTMLATRVGWRIGGLKIGLLSGIFLAISGIYDMEALGFGMSAEVIGGLLLINLLINNFDWNLETPNSRKKYYLGGAYLAVSYLFYTSTLPVIGIYHLLVGYKAYKNQPYLKTIQKYFFYTAPFVLFYVLYNLIFLGIPAYAVFFHGATPYGQLAQNLGRAHSTINYNSLLSNLMVMNWFVIPFISWIILGVGIWYQIRKHREIFLIFLGYAILWSFYISGNTGQHFLAYFCWLLPFGIVSISNFLSRFTSRIRLLVWLVLLSLMFIWTYQVHLKMYTYDSYPRSLATNFWAEPLGWPNNIYRPVVEIATSMNERLGPKGKYITLIDTSFEYFYFYNSDGDRAIPANSAQLKIVQVSGSPCFWTSWDVIKSLKIRAIVTYSNQFVCPDIAGEIITYPGSNLKLTFIK